ncbi:hypothetical protein [Janthinobacterium sp. FW305-128]|uniref:hypothetical protein n=1 Tax=Janthinobacterium sp. FW305-128 TaxID=2775055 RepID=UPI001E43996E|nr:hypothetical protein [Janthinobacterium sp. FW305-128]MCC7684736.1 hypothetical protein [Janthinobacterium sp. FW305-128]
MLKLVKLLVLLIFIISIVDRLVWVNAQGGLQGWAGADVLAVSLPGCEHRSVEYKQSSMEGVAVYRCSTIDMNIPIWPFWRGGRSKELLEFTSNYIQEKNGKN